MDLVLCHVTADFDTLGAAVGLTRLSPGAKVVLTGGCHPTVRDFLALHRDEYELIERRSVNPQLIKSVSVVDTQKRDRLGKAAEWLDLPDLVEVAVYDHHLDARMDIPATRTQIEPVGATTTLIVEKLRAEQIQLTSSEATVMALGIHVDTGSLTFEGSTPRDAIALAWLLEQGANLRLIAEYVEPGLSPQLQDLLTEALSNLQTSTHWGYTISWVLLKTSSYVPGLSSLASQLISLTESDALLIADVYPAGNGEDRLSAIGRSRIPETNLNELFQPLGGGGHSQAASVTLRGVNSQEIVDRLVLQLTNQIPQPPTARDLMSSPVRTIPPDTTIGEAQRILLRYGHSGLCVVNSSPSLVGIISRRDIDLALHHGFSHASVKGYMSKNLKTIAPNTLLPEIESLMVTYDIGRLPVLEDGQLVGIVTRTDVLRQMQQKAKGKAQKRSKFECRGVLQYAPTSSNLGARQAREREEDSILRFDMSLLTSRLDPALWEFLTKTAEQAEQRGWHLYLVGGGVRDLLLADPQKTLMLSDIDLVVDGFHRAADVGAGVEMAKSLQKIYPNARLEVHGQFQTAALLWHKDPVLGSLWVDIATARTEFYPYPAANPEVEASSIRQDLYRRDFTINALAVRLTAPLAGELLDFFNGLLDLRSQQIRVLHANSFIEDPTRIYRAVRFAVRLGFEIESQTEGYIRYALESGVYERSLLENTKAPALTTRLKAELKYILQAPYWKPALKLIADLGALRCLHPTLKLDDRLWKQVRLVDRCLRRFDPQLSLELESIMESSESSENPKSKIQNPKSIDHWQIRLEVLIAHLATQYRAQVATNLQLPDSSIARLKNLAQAQAEVVESLSKDRRPSEVVSLLRRYELPTLILIAVQSPRSIRRQIWQYLTNWANIQPPLNGNDLKALGYKPGRQFKQILDELLAATLDGVMSDRQASPAEIRASAEAFLAEHYPLF